MTESGPPYPPAPAAGSNAIGIFQIGISPIGSISPFNIWDTVNPEYANSPVITSLIESWFDALDLTQVTDQFYDDMWNIATAVGYGLDVWGRIVGVSRVLNIAAGSYFGFEEAVSGGGISGFNQSPFFSGETTTTNFVLSDENYRQLILAKAAYNICDGSIPSINAILMNLFGTSGQCYVTDNGGMSMTYTFNFQPTLLQLAIIYQSGVLPKPAGVEATVIINP